jgi:hypothetical protein
METDTNKLIQDKWDSLPLDIKQALTNIPWKNRVRDIAQIETLDGDETDQLETELLLVLYGFVPPEDLTHNLVTELSLEEEQAERIVKMIEDRIIADIEKQLEMTDALRPEVTANIPPVAPPQATAAPVAVVEPTAKQPEEIPSSSSLPEIAPNILPEVLSNEEAHDSSPEVKPETQVPAEKSNISEANPQAPLTVNKPLEPTTPTAEVKKKNGYLGGIDPYREPIE